MRAAFATQVELAGADGTWCNEHLDLIPACLGSNSPYYPKDKMVTSRCIGEVLVDFPLVDYYSSIISRDTGYSHQIITHI